MWKPLPTLFACCLLIGCFEFVRPSSEAVTASASRPTATSPRLPAASDDAPNRIPAEQVKPFKLTSQLLPNSVQVHEKVISGGLPEGDAAFRELADRGVKTVISVDGKKPAIATAARHGLRYVHLPHGYDGIPTQRIKELAKAVRDLEGPVYIHCHHGKHRSPAAASVACVSAGLIPSSAAVSVLKVAGTSPHYRGLYAAAEHAKAFDVAVLNKLQVEFKEVQEVPPMAEAMVHLSHAHEHLRMIDANSWRTPENHPDLVPTHEALLMRELFTEMLRADEIAGQPEDFRKWLRDSETAAQELEAELRKRSTGIETPDSSAGLSQLADKISANCKSCHQKYRDVPPNEKRS